MGASPAELMRWVSESVRNQPEYRNSRGGPEFGNSEIKVANMVLWVFVERNLGGKENPGNLRRNQIRNWNTLAFLPSLFAAFPPPLPRKFRQLLPAI
jgi:hypothetical protein